MEIKLKSQSEADDEIMIQVDRKVQECEVGMMYYAMALSISVLFVLQL